MDKQELRSVAESLVKEGKGILAADQSPGSVKKMFDPFGIENSDDNRRALRELLFTTDKVEQFISGVILHQETMHQKDFNGKPFPQVLWDKGIVPGIKLDQGKVPLANFPGEKVSVGLDSLRERAEENKNLGAKFAKWRALINIDIEQKLPTDTAIEANSEVLARYATICQEVGLVPIVEPEVLMSGRHDLNTAQRATYRTLKTLFNRLSAHRVYFEGMLLKPNWVHSGYDSPDKASNEEISRATLDVLKEAVPVEVPGIVFLSGGDTPEASTSHLDLMNEMQAHMTGAPWHLSFSYGRALQEPVIRAWQAKPENWEKAQKEFYKRAKLNSKATTGAYEASMEQEDG